MSHFTVLVIGADHDAQLAPFSEEIRVDTYISSTRHELIERNRDNLTFMRDHSYAEYLADPKDYLERFKHNLGHCKYFTDGEFATKLNWTDEQLYQDAIKYAEPYEIDSEGNELSTYNPNAKWDWYQVGGRWDGFFKTKEGKDVNATTIGELDFSSLRPTFAVLKYGEWHEKGEMGWWAMVSKEKAEEDWATEFHELFQGLPDSMPITLIDAHI